MPQVPKSDPQISMNVPGVNAPLSRQFGQLGNSIENAGNQILSSGMETLIQVKRAEASDAANNAYMQDRLDAESKIQALKLQSPDGYIHSDPSDTQSDIIQNDDGTRRTITQEFHSWADDRYRTNQEKMPSELAAQIYRERALPHISSQIAMLQNDAQVMKVKSFDLTSEMAVKKSGDQMADSPGPYTARPLGPNGESRGGVVDMTNFYATTNDHTINRSDQIGNMYNATGAQERTFQDNQKLSYYAMQGAYVQIYADKKNGDPGRVDKITAWLDVLHGKDPASLQQSALGKSTLSNMMDPKQKELEEKKLLSLLPGANKQDRSDWNHFYENTRAAEQAGRTGFGAPSDPVYSKTLQDIVRFSTLPSTDPNHMSRGEAIDKFTDLVSDRSVGQAKGAAFKMMTPDAQDKYIESTYQNTISTARTLGQKMGLSWTDNEGARAANNIRDKLLNLKSQEDTAKKTDLAAYLMTPAENGDRTMQTAETFSKVIPTQSMVALQNPQNRQIIQKWLRDSKSAQGVIAPNNPEYWRPMDKGLSDHWGGTLSDPKVSEQLTWSNFKGLYNGFGSHDGPKAIEQMVDDNKLDQSWLVATGINPNRVSQDTGTKIISAIRGNKSIDEQFKVNAAATGMKETDIQGAVSKLTAPWAMAQDAKNPYSTISHNNQAAAVKVVTAYAKSLYNSDTSLTADTAAERAYNTILGHQVTPVKNGAPGLIWGNRGQGYSNEPNEMNGKTVSDQEKANIEANMTKILSPEGLKGLGLDRPTVNGKPDLQDEHWEGVASRTAYRSFTTSPAPGYHLFYKYGPDENRVPFMKGGKPVFIPYSDAVRGNGQVAPPPPQKFPPRPQPSVPARGGMDKL